MARIHCRRSCSFLVAVERSQLGDGSKCMLAVAVCCFVAVASKGCSQDNNRNVVCATLSSELKLSQRSDRVRRKMRSVASARFVPVVLVDSGRN